ncbi:hypothetical protein HDG34_003357 [Paraburkholderia sp. HC6.4b]|nr:hypothetical protein [Paraburkholderia sp. HC6.4b]MBB5451145.1 hypothetical protein [Paraburkholderia sp. Kb1A]
MDFWANAGTATKMAAYLVVAGVASLTLNKYVKDLFNTR